MLGTNHIGANICSLVLVSDLVIYAEKYYTGRFCDYISSAGRTVHEFVQETGSMPDIIYYVICLGLYLLGTLMPDMDNPKSLLGRYVHIPVKHRTWMHAIWIPIIIFIGSVFFRPLFWLGAGFTLHLFWDSLSIGGICWFYPISQYKTFDSGAQIKRYHILKLYRTGKVSEYVILGILTAVTLGFSGYIAYRCGIMDSLLNFELPKI